MHRKNCLTMLGGRCTCGERDASGTPILAQAPASPPASPAPRGEEGGPGKGMEEDAPAVHRYGLDSEYFRKELSRLLATLNDRPGGELARYLRALAKVADPVGEGISRAVKTGKPSAPSGLRDAKRVEEPGLTFAALRQANIERLPEFKNPHGRPAHEEPDGSDWRPAQWLQAVVGELGEYANIRKKFERGDLEREEFRELAWKELADVQTYLDILARRCLDSEEDGAHPTGIDLGQATIDKFNLISERVGSSVRLSSEGWYRESEAERSEVPKPSAEGSTPESSPEAPPTPAPQGAEADKLRARLIERITENSALLVQVSDLERKVETLEAEVNRLHLRLKLTEGAARAMREGAAERLEAQRQPPAPASPGGLDLEGGE